MEESPVNVLLVDDHPENLAALEALLSAPGHNLVSANSGKQALKHVLDQEFAVILLDVQMPEMDGYETASLIRSREASRHVPIIFLTAIGKSREHMKRGYALGAVDYLFKPFEAEALRAKVAAFVELSRKTAALKREIKRRREAEEEVRALNDALEERVRERTAVLQQEVAERRQGEKALRRQRAEIEALNEQLRRAMRETHHRVRNNLQMIAAMTDLLVLEGLPMIPVEEVKRIGRQVRVLAAVHDLLTDRSRECADATSICARDVLQKLGELVEQSMPGRHVHVDAEDVLLTARQGSSLAIVVNELVLNALKNSDADVVVKFRLEEDRALLTVEDHGPGFAENFDPIMTASTGLELVRSIASWDLAGAVDFGNRPEGGGLVTLRMPLRTDAVAA